MGDLAQGYRRVSGARIAGVVAAVPPRKVTNEHFVPAFGESGVAEVTKAVSDMPCGGQIIMTSETLADIESMHDLMLKVCCHCVQGEKKGGIERGRTLCAFCL